jgi:hypothetical protein
MQLEDTRPWLVWALLVDFVGFSLFTVYVLLEYGMGWIAVAFANPVSTLVTIDLFIALSMVMGWVYVDAKERNVSPWPYLLLTLGTGSVGTLLYLLVRERPGAPRYADEEGVPAFAEARS